MRILDIDLDFFLNDVAYWPSGDRLDKELFSPWKEEAVRDFLEKQCGLTQNRRIPGRYIPRHHEALFFWKELIEAGVLHQPFEVVHIDAHADLGTGDPGYVYLMTDILRREVSQRANLEIGRSKLNEGNYLAFAVACRWISRIIFVPNARSRDDLMFLHFKDFDSKTSALQLKPCDEKQLDKWLITQVALSAEAFEPEVPFVRVAPDEYENTDPFSFAVLCHSLQFTPPSADSLIPIIMEYIDPI